MVWTVDPATLPGAYPGPKRRRKLGSYRYPEVQSVRDDGGEPAGRGLASADACGKGAKGPLVHEFAVVRVWAMRHYKPGPPIWLLLRRTTEKTDLKYYVSNASAETPWQEIALAGGSAVARGGVLGRREDALGDGGLRGPLLEQLAPSHEPGGAGASVRDVDEAGRRSSDVPELTLDMALRVLRSAFARPTLSEDEAMDIIDYHLERNRVAHESHRKSWLAKHKRAGQETLAVEIL